MAHIVSPTTKADTGIPCCLHCHPVIAPSLPPLPAAAATEYFQPSKGYCTSVVALYDTHAAQDSLVACVVPGTGFCVYRTNTDGKIFGRTWCTPAFNSSATTIAGSSINIALDINRRSYVATIDDKSDTNATRPTVFRVRIDGKFGVSQLLSNGLQDLTLDGSVKVFGAIPASQVRLQGSWAVQCARLW